MVAGSVTIYRRFGAYPVHDMPGAKVLSNMKRASAALATVEDANAAEAVKFAKWWLDPTIPTKVETFMIWQLVYKRASRPLPDMETKLRRRH